MSRDTSRLSSPKCVWIMTIFLSLDSSGPVVGGDIRNDFRRSFYSLPTNEGAMYLTWMQDCKLVRLCFIPEASLNLSSWSRNKVEIYKLCHASFHCKKKIKNFINFFSFSRQSSRCVSDRGKCKTFESILRILPEKMWKIIFKNYPSL